MKNQALFTAGLLEAMEPKPTVLELMPIHRKKYQTMVDYIRRCIGQPQDVQMRPYRIAGERYMAVMIAGNKSHFNLTLSLAGYLTWPECQVGKLVYRFYMDVVDGVDGHYFVEYLKQDLLNAGPDNTN